MSSVNGIGTGAVVYQQSQQVSQKAEAEAEKPSTVSQPATDTITLSEEGKKLAEGTVSPLSAGGTQLPPLPK